MAGFLVFAECFMCLHRNGGLTRRAAGLIAPSSYWLTSLLGVSPGQEATYRVKREQLPGITELRGRPRGISDRRIAGSSARSACEPY